MRRIFVSYRRAESEYAAGALGRELRRFFGDEYVFRDKEDITGGVSWRQHVLQAIEGDSALLVLISKNWTHTTDAHGKRRLDDSTDPVRLEIADAIREGAAVFPILLEGAEMPGEAELPVEIRPLAEYNALRLRDGDWSHDINKILGTLEKLGFKARQAAAGDNPRTAGPAIPATRRPYGKLVTSCILSVVFGVTAADGNPSNPIDRCTYATLGFFCLGSLALATFAHRDYLEGKSSSKWPATVAVALRHRGGDCVLRQSGSGTTRTTHASTTDWRRLDSSRSDRQSRKRLEQFSPAIHFPGDDRGRPSPSRNVHLATRQRVMGTEDVTGQYEDKTRMIILEGDAVRDIPHEGVERLAVGSYFAVLSSGDRALVEGRWGSSQPDGILGRWEAGR